MVCCAVLSNVQPVKVSIAYCRLAKYPDLRELHRMSAMLPQESSSSGSSSESSSESEDSEEELRNKEIKQLEKEVGFL